MRFCWREFRNRDTIMKPGPPDTGGEPCSSLSSSDLLLPAEHCLGFSLIALPLSSGTPRMTSARDSHCTIQVYATFEATLIAA